MRFYYGIVRQEGDSAYGVEFPGLDGCHSAADTFDDVYDHAIEALELWFEDQPLTDPVGPDQIARDYAEDLRDGAILVRVPFIEHADQYRRVNISLDAAMLDAIDEMAGRRKLTRSGLIDEAAREYIHRRA